MFTVSNFFIELLCFSYVFFETTIKNPQSGAFFMQFFLLCSLKFILLLKIVLLFLGVLLRCQFLQPSMTENQCLSVLSYWDGKRLTGRHTEQRFLRCQKVRQIQSLLYSFSSFLCECRTEIIWILLFLQVIIAVHILLFIFLIEAYRFSSRKFRGKTSRFLSLKSCFVSLKSIPCLFLLIMLLLGSYSNFI